MRTVWVFAGIAATVLTEAANAQSLGRTAPAHLATVSEFDTAAPVGTPIRLMVMKEVTSRYAKVGDRFRLRVDQPVVVEGKVALPIGATAWGEVVAVAGTNVGGQSGKVATRLLYVETAEGVLPLNGTSEQEGNGNTAGVLIGMRAWGPLALLNHGHNGKLKAGDIITGYVAAGR